MGAPTNEDWGHIHAKAWKDSKYRHLLETDPTAAVKAYGKETGKTFDKIVHVDNKPAHASESTLHTAHLGPPACC